MLEDVTKTQIRLPLLWTQAHFIRDSTRHVRCSVGSRMLGAADTETSEAITPGLVLVLRKRCVANVQVVLRSLFAWINLGSTSPRHFNIVSTSGLVHQHAQDALLASPRQVQRQSSQCRRLLKRCRCTPAMVWTSQTKYRYISPTDCSPKT
jgi:hypothetical protein